MLLSLLAVLLDQVRLVQLLLAIVRNFIYWLSTQELPPKPCIPEVSGVLSICIANLDINFATKTICYCSGFFNNQICITAYSFRVGNLWDGL